MTITLFLEKGHNVGQDHFDEAVAAALCLGGFQPDLSQFAYRRGFLKRRH